MSPATSSPKPPRSRPQTGSSTSPLDRRRAVAALALSAATHYAIDRSAGHWSDDPQSPAATRLVRAAHTIGKGGWLQHDPQAPYRLDQALHKALLALCAAVAAH